MAYDANEQMLAKLSQHAGEDASASSDDESDSDSDDISAKTERKADGKKTKAKKDDDNDSDMVSVGARLIVLVRLVEFDFFGDFCHGCEPQLDDLPAAIHRIHESPVPR